MRWSGPLFRRCLKEFSRRKWEIAPVLFLCNATISFQKHLSHFPVLNAVMACESWVAAKSFFLLSPPYWASYCLFCRLPRLPWNSAYCAPTERADRSCEFHNHPIPLEPSASAVHQWHQPGIQGTPFSPGWPSWSVTVLWPMRRLPTSYFMENPPHKITKCVSFGGWWGCHHLPKVFSALWVQKLKLLVFKWVVLRNRATSFEKNYPFLN